MRVFIHNSQRQCRFCRVLIPYRARAKSYCVTQSRSRLLQCFWIAVALIVIEMESTNYSFNEINRIVESNDAQITQLNTLTDPETGIMQVTIRVNKMEVSNIISSFQRYEYSVKYYFGEELYENELRNNYDNLMNYLNI